MAEDHSHTPAAPMPLFRTVPGLRQRSVAGRADKLRRVKTSLLQRVVNAKTHYTNSGLSVLPLELLEGPADCWRMTVQDLPAITEKLKHSRHLPIE